MKSAQRYAELGLVLLIVVLVNVAAQRVFHRCDLTDDKRYTLSAASRKTLGQLEDTLTIKAFFSKNIPPSQAAAVTGVRDILDEFKAHGGARVQVEFIDPYDDPETQQEMRLLGVPELTMTVYGRDQLEQLKVYMGVGIFYQDRKEVIQAVSQVTEFEYNLTSSILKIAASEPPTIAIWLGNPLPAAKTFWEDYQRYQLEEQLDPLYQALKRQYKVIEVDFGGGKPVPEQVNALFVIGPKKVSERDLYEIDQFVMRGGKVVFLLDVQNQDEQMQALPTPSGLEPLLEHYGLRLRSSVVADRRCERAPFRTRYFQSIAPYPFWPKVAAEGIDRENPALSQLQSIVLPWTAAIEVSSSNLEGKKFTPLLKSSDFATAHDLPARVFGEQEGVLPASEVEPLVLAGMIEGKLTSYFKDRPLPPQAVPVGEQAPKLPPSLKQPPFTDQTENGRVIVVGSSQFVTAQFLSLFQQLRSGAQNLLFVQNLADWLALGDGLIEMRSRLSPVRALENASEGAKQAIQYGNILAVPALVILYGLARFFLRRKDRRMYEERFRFHTRPGGAAGLERKS